MSPEIYTTPSGIAVERTHSKVPYQRGLDRLLRKLDTQRGIYLSSGYEFPGRYSRWDIAALAPPLETLRARPRSRSSRRSIPAAKSSTAFWSRCSPRIRIGSPSRNDNGTLRGHPEASARALSRGTAQQAAVGVLHPPRADRRVPPSPRRPALARRSLRLRSPVPLRSHQAQAPPHRCQRPPPVPLRRHLLHGSQEGTDRALPVRFRARRRSPHAACQAHRRARQAAQEAPVRAHRLRSRRPKSTWPRSRPCAKACAAATITKSCCARPSPRPTPAAPPSCSSASSKASPSPYEFFLQFGDEQLIGASPEMFVRVEGRRVETCPISGTVAPHRRCDARRRQHQRAAQLDQGRVRADHVHRRRPQRQVARVRARLGAGARTAA